MKEAEYIEKLREIGAKAAKEKNIKIFMNFVKKGIDPCLGPHDFKFPILRALAEITYYDITFEDFKYVIEQYPEAWSTYFIAYIMSKTRLYNNVKLDEKTVYYEKILYYMLDRDQHRIKDDWEYLPHLIRTTITYIPELLDDLVYKYKIDILHPNIEGNHEQTKEQKIDQYWIDMWAYVSNDYCSPLNAKTKCIDYLISGGADLFRPLSGEIYGNLQNKYPPLGIFMKNTDAIGDKNGFTTLEYLLEQGINLNDVRSPSLSITIYFRYAFGNLEYMTEECFNPIIKYGQRYFEYAIFGEEKQKIVKLLVQYGADPETKDMNGLNTYDHIDRYYQSFNDRIKKEEQRLKNSIMQEEYPEEDMDYLGTYHPLDHYHPYDHELKLQKSVIQKKYQEKLIREISESYNFKDYAWKDCKIKFAAAVKEGIEVNEHNRKVLSMWLKYMLGWWLGPRGLISKNVVHMIVNEWHGPIPRKLDSGDAELMRASYMKKWAADEFKKEYSNLFTANNKNKIIKKDNDLDIKGRFKLMDEHNKDHDVYDEDIYDEDGKMDIAKNVALLNSSKRFDNSTHKDQIQQKNEALILENAQKQESNCTCQIFVLNETELTQAETVRELKQNTAIKQALKKVYGQKITHDDDGGVNNSNEAELQCKNPQFNTQKQAIYQSEAKQEEMSHDEEIMQLYMLEEICTQTDSQPQTLELHMPDWMAVNEKLVAQAEYAAQTGIIFGNTLDNALQFGDVTIDMLNLYTTSF